MLLTVPNHPPSLFSPFDMAHFVLPPALFGPGGRPLQTDPGSASTE